MPHTPGELQATMHHAGLTRQALGTLLNTSPRIIKQWLDGRATIPDWAMQRTYWLDTQTDRLIERLAELIETGKYSAITTYRSSTLMPHNPARTLTAQWWNNAIIQARGMTIRDMPVAHIHRDNQPTPPGTLTPEAVNPDALQNLINHMQAPRTPRGRTQKPRTKR